jgi:hypothetical protein
LIGIHHQGSANHPGNLDFHLDSFHSCGGTRNQSSAF